MSDNIDYLLSISDVFIEDDSETIIALEKEIQCLTSHNKILVQLLCISTIIIYFLIVL